MQKVIMVFWLFKLMFIELYIFMRKDYQKSPKHITHLLISPIFFHILLVELIHPILTY